MAPYVSCNASITLKITRWLLKYSQNYQISLVSIGHCWKSLAPSSWICCALLFKCLCSLFPTVVQKYSLDSLCETRIRFRWWTFKVLHFQICLWTSSGLWTSEHPTVAEVLRNGNAEQTGKIRSSLDSKTENNLFTNNTHKSVLTFNKLTS